jgi:hypothetical protein
MICYVYKRANEATWLVGYFDPAGRWFTETTQPDPELAALRVRWLHGGSMPSAEIFEQPRSERDRLPQVLRRPWFYWGMPK